MTRSFQYPAAQTKIIRKKNRNKLKKSNKKYEKEAKNEFVKIHRESSSTRLKRLGAVILKRAHR